jgi:hypothetical protein
MLLFIVLGIRVMCEYYCIHDLFIVIDLSNLFVGFVGRPRSNQYLSNCMLAKKSQLIYCMIYLSVLFFVCSVFYIYDDF